jgi:hypothetical protein
LIQTVVIAGSTLRGVGVALVAHAVFAGRSRDPAAGFPVAPPSPMHRAGPPVRP